MQKKFKVIKDKYTYRAVTSDDIHPGARSSCSFEKGIFFCFKKAIFR